MGRNSVAKVLWTCVLQVQRKFRSDSVHVAPLETARIITVEMIPYYGPMSHGTRGCLAWVRWGPRSGRSALLVVGFSVLVSILLCSLSMSRAALSTRLVRALSFRGSCSWLGSLLVFLSRMCSSTTCGISGCSEGSPACYRQFLTMLKQGKLFSLILPFDFVVAILEYCSISLIGNKLQCRGIVIYYSFIKEG